MLGIGNLASWRGAFDFDAPGLATRERLCRLSYAVGQADRQHADPRRRGELAFVQEECRALLAMGSLEGDETERERVGQRMVRIRRVVAYHEGSLVRLNRQYWWVPFSLGLLAIGCGCAEPVCCCVGDLWCLLSCMCGL